MSCTAQALTEEASTTQVLVRQPRPEHIPLHGAPEQTNVLNFVDFQRRLGKATRINEARTPSLPAPARLSTSSDAQADREYDRASNVLDYFAAAFIMMSVAFGPMLLWVLTR
jgi:hypothetical protein